MPATIMHQNKKITSTGPSDSGEWQDVSRFSEMNLLFQCTSSSGTAQRMECCVQFTDNPATTSNNGFEALESKVDFFDTTESVSVHGVKVVAPWARIYRTVSGTSPEFYLTVTASTVEG
tara:strand:+ start:1945 stop:2301 length:357 start_codon:yes stop_codon:yes gene_type:complete